ncbi:MAG: hypothetical protein HQRvContig05_22 [Haloquadratum phage sp.]|nr:MAG: hypothetical protein HQRvContig05_22 [Haloquadratum phage sp.]
MALSVNVTINMPMEMVDDVTEQAESHDMSRAEYVRHLIRQAEDSPFDVPAERLTAAESQSEEGAA